MLASKYSQLLLQTEEYIEEDIKAVQMLASIQLSDLLAENPQILGTVTSGENKTEKQIDADISKKRSELRDKRVDEMTAQDSYDNAQNDYEALYGERFVRPGEFKDIQEKRDERRDDLGKVRREITNLENEISELEIEKQDLENSPKTKSVEFLTKFLETNPSPNELQECINEIQSMVIDMQDGSIVPTNLSSIVRKIIASMER